jgi:hypothetical protein
MYSMLCKTLLCSATLMLVSINIDAKAQSPEPKTQRQTHAAIPPDKLDNYCFFNGFEFSEGSLFCVKPGMALHCVKIKEDPKPVRWIHVTPDAACAELKLR